MIDELTTAFAIGPVGHRFQQYSSGRWQEAEFWEGVSIVLLVPTCRGCIAESATAYPSPAHLAEALPRLLPSGGVLVSLLDGDDGTTELGEAVEVLSLSLGWVQGATLSDAIARFYQLPPSTLKLSGS